MSNSPLSYTERIERLLNVEETNEAGKIDKELIMEIVDEMQDRLNEQETRIDELESTMIRIKNMIDFEYGR